MKSCFALLSLFVLAAAAVEFSNINPRRSAATGQIIDAHDGNYLQINGTWYYWGMVRKTTIQSICLKIPL